MDGGLPATYRRSRSRDSGTSNGVGQDIPTAAALRGGGGGSRGAASCSNIRLSSAVESSEATAAVAAPEDGVEVIKPERDERSYRYLTLPNGLAVMLVSDSDTEKAAASMFIRVGHMQVPDLEA